MPKKREEQFESHRDCQALTGLVLEHLPRDRQLGRTRRYRKGVDVWRPDDRADSVYFLRRGQVAVMLGDARGSEVIVRVVGAGEPFGELCFCSARGDVRGTSARAVVESEAVEIKLKDFLSYLQESSDALTALVFTMCERLTEAEHRIEVLMHRGAEERLGMLLLQLASARGKAGRERKGEVSLPVTQEELAQMAAMSRPHVTVTMGRFRRLGLVRYERGGPISVNVFSLRDYLGGGLKKEGARGEPKKRRPAEGKGA